MKLPAHAPTKPTMRRNAMAQRGENVKSIENRIAFPCQGSDGKREDRRRGSHNPPAIPFEQVISCSEHVGRARAYEVPPQVMLLVESDVQV
jgi:hypothetical protein